MAVVSYEPIVALASSSRLNPAHPSSFGHWIFNLEYIPDLSPPRTFGESVRVSAVALGLEGFPPDAGRNHPQMVGDAGFVPKTLLLRSGD